MFATPAPVVLLKFAMSPVPTLNKPKLWNRLPPARVPPVMSNELPAWLTAVPRPPAPGVGVIAVVTWAWAAVAWRTTTATSRARRSRGGRGKGRPPFPDLIGDRVSSAPRAGTEADGRVEIHRSKAREDIRPAQCRHGVAARDPNLPVVKRGLQVNDTVVVNVSQLHALRLSQAWPESQAPLINRLAREGYVAYQIDRQEPIVTDIDHGVRRVLLQRRDRRQRSQDGVGERRGITTGGG